jgi:hypothetical protein
VNEIGESFPTAYDATVSAAGNKVVLTLGTGGGSAVRYFNVYRSAVNGLQTKFVGRVAYAGAATLFVDLGNKSPGFVTGFLVQGDTMGIKELAPYSRLKLAVTDLSQPEAHFRFLTLAVYQPRKNVLLDSLAG